MTYEYDYNKYELTLYKKSGVAENVNSDATSAKNSNSAITDMIYLEKDFENIDIGLIRKEKLDFQINKYLSSVKVITGNKEQEYEFDDKEIAKIEIKSRNLKKSKVELHYSVVIENIGNVEGFVEKVVDYLPDGLEFSENDNSNWYLGNDKNVYTKNLDNISLKPGEKRKIELVLVKNMTEENTGFVNNKVELINCYNGTNIKENTDNNTSMQSTAILPSTGFTTAIIYINAIVNLGIIILIISKLKFKNKKFYR